MDAAEKEFAAFRAIKIGNANLDIEEAIQTENFEKVSELINIYDDINKSHALSTALQVGNVEIVALLLENGTEKLEMKQTELDSDAEIHPMLFVAQQKYDEAKKGKIIELLLPHVYVKNLYPWRPDYYSPLDFCDLILDCCRCNNTFLLDFLIHKFYAAKYNSLYSLIQKIEATVDDSQKLCIFLHDDIHGFELISEEYFFDRTPIVDIFLQILAKNTAETVEIAVEVYKVLMDKNFSEETNEGYYCQNLQWPPINRVFQFLLCSYDPEMVEPDVISDFLEIISSYNEFFELAWQCALPLFLKPKHRKRAIKDFGMNKKRKEITTKDFVKDLKESCRDVVRSKIIKAVNFNTKEFFQRVWTLFLPETLKCYLLGIPDASWMNDLPM